MQPLMPEVVVNGVTIPAARIAAEAQNHPAPKGKPGLAWRAAARALALRELMLQEARARGLVPAPRDIAPGLRETDEEALIRQLLELAVIPAPVDDEALRAAYDAAPDRYRAPPLWEAAHILFAAPETAVAARETARTQAEATLADLRARPERWDDLARDRSACSSGKAGGRLGQIGPGDTVAAFEAALRGMRAGETAGPVETRFGFHLIRLDAVAEGAVLPFRAVLPRLREAAEKVAWVRASRDYAAELLARAMIEGIRIEAA
ncbi:MAG TPA: peptidylprolyl isomerase [Paracoccus sp. (in: a-proteobacteria)]|nr:peptidylprolyl isomerase [Paracoccus sp. (in: a-proteobacteria)]